MTSDLLDWTPQGHPRSKLYGDVYFSAQDGLAESRAVFLKGCGLPLAWQGRRSFTLGELGFGTGLNILALLDLWSRTSDPEARLQIFSVEAHLITPDEADRALALWPELADLTANLLSRWPAKARGFHRIDFPECRATLDIALMPADQALATWSGAADAWFLDGFSPALNPEIWTPGLMALVAKRSAPGARVATFTVAGQVRRGLQAAGFSVEKRPGYGRKRERLEARLPGVPAVAPPPSVAVIGAGIAGASLVRALHALGINPLVFEAKSVGAGASGNPAALVMPRLDAGLAAPAELAAQAFRRAVALYGQHRQAIIATGVLQLASDGQDARRYAKIAASDLFAPGSMLPVDATAASAHLGEASDQGGLQVTQALVIEPSTILQVWLGPISPHAVDRLAPQGGGWQLIGGDGTVLAQVDVVILACAMDAVRLAPEAGLLPVRGQASWTVGGPSVNPASRGGYLLPTRDGLLFGATHDRGQMACDLRAEDDVRNLESLAALRPQLAASIAAKPLEARAAIRATTTDYMPLAGQGSQPGLYLLTGLGSRGFSWAPALAEHVVALVTGTPSPLPTTLSDLVDPARFARRAARKGRNFVAEPD